MEEYVIAQRRRFHKIPELSLQEKETAETIRDELRKSGVPYESAGEYGTIACIKGALPGKTVAPVPVLPAWLPAAWRAGCR